MSSSNEETEEEELIIYAESEDNVNIEKYRSIHVLGINEKNPIVQMDDTFFIGKYENPLGTYMFFEEDPAPQCHDQLFDKLAEKNLKFLTKTRKLLRIEHAYVSSKGNDSNPSKTDPNTGEAEELEPVSFKSVQEALDQFKPILTPGHQLEDCEMINKNESREEKTTEK